MAKEPKNLTPSILMKEPRNCCELYKGVAAILWSGNVLKLESGDVTLLSSPFTF